MHGWDHGREAMTLAGGSSSYFMHRGGIAGSDSGSQVGGLYNTPGFRPLSNTSFSPQPNIRGSSDGSTFAVESSRANFSHGNRMEVPSGVPSSEPVKKKRGRPRKYGPDGKVSLGLSPMSAPAYATPDSGSPTNKRSRGRPPGSGRKQQLAALGDWMNDSAGLAFAPHVVIIGVGEDIVAKLLSFAQQRSRALCILSGCGTVSSVSLRQPASTGVSVTYEGLLQILCLSGSYLVAEDGDPRNRTGGISASLSNSDGHVIGGAVAMLVAASPVQVVVCSFVHGGKSKTKQIAGSKTEENIEAQHGGNILTTPTSTPPTQSYTPSATGIWPGSAPTDIRNPHTGIDLMRG